MKHMVIDAPEGSPMLHRGMTPKGNPSLNHSQMTKTGMGMANGKKKKGGCKKCK